LITLAENHLISMMHLETIKGQSSASGNNPAL
jgi:hypothetical protein